MSKSASFNYLGTTTFEPRLKSRASQKRAQAHLRTKGTGSLEEGRVFCLPSLISPDGPVFAVSETCVFYFLFCFFFSFSLFFLVLGLESRTLCMLRKFSIIGSSTCYPAHPSTRLSGCQAQQPSKNIAAMRHAC